jgi:hypothetical protein
MAVIDEVMRFLRGGLEALRKSITRLGQDQ